MKNPATTWRYWLGPIVAFTVSLLAAILFITAPAPSGPPNEWRIEIVAKTEGWSSDLVHVYCITSPSGRTYLVYSDHRGYAGGATLLGHHCR